MRAGRVMAAVLLAVVLTACGDMGPTGESIRDELGEIAGGGAGEAGDADGTDAEAVEPEEPAEEPAAPDPEEPAEPDPDPAPEEPADAEAAAAGDATAGDDTELVEDPAERGWLLALVLAAIAAAATTFIVRLRRHKAALLALFDRASTDVAWLLDEAVGPAAVADREAHTRDVRKRSDRLHDTLSELASQGSQDLAAGAVDLRQQANELARTLVGRLGDPTADHRHLDVQLGEQRERTRAAHERLETIVRG
jgi:hypothetical protein